MEHEGQPARTAARSRSAKTNPSAAPGLSLAAVELLTLQRSAGNAAICGAVFEDASVADALLTAQRSGGKGPAAQSSSGVEVLVSRQASPAESLAGKLTVGSSTVAEGNLAISFADVGKLLTAPKEVAS